MTKFELRYGTKTIETEVKLTLQEFVEVLSTTIWYVLEEGVAVQVSMIDSVKVIE